MLCYFICAKFINSGYFATKIPTNHRLCNQAAVSTVAYFKLEKQYCKFYNPAKCTFQLAV